MGNTIHAFDFLEQSGQPPEGRVFVLFGQHRFLQLLVKQQLVSAFSGGDDDFNSSYFDGDKANLSEIQDQLCTASLFDASGSCLVVVDPADDFIKRFRGELEKVLDRPLGGGRLLMLLTTWASNTRLYKLLDRIGCQIDCNDPVPKRSRSKKPDTHRIVKWLITRGQQEHQIKLSSTHARNVLELVQWNLGQADQELAKLALMTDDASKLTSDDIRRIVGGWRAQSIWEAAEAAVTGNTRVALEHLSQLLHSGEHPLALYGQLAWSLRRYGRLSEVIDRRARAGERPDISVALRSAGFRTWNDELSRAGQAFSQLGTQRIKQVYRSLLQTDLALKGTHSDERRARIVLETLFAGMSDQMNR